MSSLNVSRIEQDVTTVEWDSFWRGCDYATYFHSREWAEIWRDYTKGKVCPAPRLVKFSDGKRALLPLSSQRLLRGLTKSYLSSPGGTFGGWLSTDNLSYDHAMLLNDYLTKRLGSIVWRQNPYDPMIQAVKPGGCIEDETHVLELNCGFESILDGWSKGHRSAARKARKARKEGVDIRTASTLNDWQDYYLVYEDSLRRWGEGSSSRYGWELFLGMFQRNSPHIKLWLAVYQGKIIAGAICFYAKKHVVYWHGAALENYFPLRPVNLLMHDAIRDACEKGYSWFDFNPSGGHEGVTAFKKSFGAQPLACPVVHSLTPLHRILGKMIKYSLRQR